MYELNGELVEQRQLLSLLGKDVEAQNRHWKRGVDKSQQFKSGPLVAEATVDLFRGGESHRSAILISQSSGCVSM
jgi:hypothetical protein